MGKRSKNAHQMHAARPDIPIKGRSKCRTSASLVQPDPPFPRDMQRHGTSLLNLQCWCWGWDVRRPAGNVLMERGFTRVRPPQPHLGSSAYTLQIGGQAAVVVWGFGFFYGDATLGGLYVSRQRFAPQLVGSAAPPSTVWDVTCLPPMHAPRSHHEWHRAYRLLITALDWIAEYEAWVLVTMGTQYRQDCVAAWRKTTLAAHDLPPAWYDLRHRLAVKLADAEHTQPLPPAIST